MANPQVAARVAPEIAEAVAEMQHAGLPLGDVLGAVAAAWRQSSRSTQVMRAELSNMAAAVVAEDRLDALQADIAAAQSELEQLHEKLAQARQSAEAEAAGILADARNTAEAVHSRAQAAEDRAARLGEAIPVAVAMRASGLAPSDAMALLQVLHEARIGVTGLPTYLRRLGGLKAAVVDLQKRVEGGCTELAEVEGRRDRALAELATARRNRDMLAAEVSGAVHMATEAATADASAAVGELREVATAAARVITPLVHLAEVREVLERDIIEMRGELEGLGVIVGKARALCQRQAETEKLRAGRPTA